MNLFDIIFGFSEKKKMIKGIIRETCESALLTEKFWLQDDILDDRSSSIRKPRESYDFCVMISRLMSIQKSLLALERERIDINKDWALMRNPTSHLLYFFDRKTGKSKYTETLAYSSEKSIQNIRDILSSNQEYSMEEQSKLTNLIFCLQSSMIKEGKQKIDASKIGYEGWFFKLEEEPLTITIGTEFQFPLGTNLRSLSLEEFRY
ncbi:hypothetical protein OQJ68_15150 [Microbulbifer thermotolerans]|uniref:DUF3298 domain-containing protein n=1 Tax=Microbulbifer thermotolerans TaxID=252514 RepID=A0AB35I0M6_MICTH|nr:hypothetical protein [Microbulbifer thermotolerans]MCX2803130.1 hypothetical protein [Microbulbifer thermotolerans]